MHSWRFGTYLIWQEVSRRRKRHLIVAGNTTYFGAVLPFSTSIGRGLGLVPCHLKMDSFPYTFHWRPKQLYLKKSCCSWNILPQDGHHEWLKSFFGSRNVQSCCLDSRNGLMCSLDFDRKEFSGTGHAFYRKQKRVTEKRMSLLRSIPARHLLISELQQAEQTDCSSFTRHPHALHTLQID